MGRIITAYPSVARTIQVVTLGDAQYRLTLTWKGRLKAWYFNLQTLAGVDIVVGRRVSPGYGPLLGLLPEGAPGGLFFVRGKDGYKRNDIGSNVAIVYYDESEIEAVDAGDAVRVVL